MEINNVIIKAPLLNQIQTNNSPQSLDSFLDVRGVSCLLWKCTRREWEKQYDKVNFLQMACKINVTIFSKLLQ